MSEPATMDDVGPTKKRKLSNSSASVEGNTPANFIIKVGEKSFNVDRETIITNSDYFRAMLAHDTAENQQGFVDMKDVDPDVIGECIEFMETGRMIEINMDNVGDVLNAAGIMQLDKISETSVEFLEGNLNPENCIRIFEIITKYSITGLQEKVQTIFKETYKINALTELVQLSETDFIKHFQQHEFSANIIAWEAIMLWVRSDIDARGKSLFTLLNTLNWQDFPSHEFLKRIWSEPMFENCQQCVDLAYERVFMDTKGFKLCLSIFNYYFLKNLTEKFKFIPRKIKDFLSEFFKDNIIKLLAMPGFQNLSKSEVIDLLSDSSIDDLTGEKWKWLAIKSWIEVEQERKYHLPDLFRCISVDKISKSFLRTIRNDALIKDCIEAQQYMLDSYLNTNSVKKRHFIAVLYTDGRIRAMDISTKSWKDLPGIDASSENQIFSLNEKLCLKSGNKLFYLSNTKKWNKKCSEMSTGLSASSKIASTEDCIYIISAQSTSRYDSLWDRWEEDLPGFRNEDDDKNDQEWEINNRNEFRYGYGNVEQQRRQALSKYCAVSNDINIYVAQAEKVKIFDRESNTWSRVSNAPSGATRQYKSAVSIFDKIYFLYDNGAQIYDRKWTDINGLPGTPGRNWSLNLDNTLFVVQENGQVFVYFPFGNSWTPYCTIPMFVSGEKGNFSTIGIASVCSFSEFESGDET